MARKGGLGRGLSALIPEQPPGEAEAAGPTAPTTAVPIDRIVPNPQQPRTEMNEQELAELADSISQHGVIQPLLVSEQQGDDGQPSYQLIAGERRWRAARAAGLTEVPVTIREATSQELLELAIIENVQRSDLSPLEEAAAYQRLINDFALTQQQVAERVGRSRTAVANTVRLLDLPPVVSVSLARGEISAGHGRALLGAGSAEELVEAWGQVVADQLNVRQTEELIRAQRAPQADDEAAPPDDQSAENLEQAIVAVADPGLRGPAVVTEGLAAALQRSLGTKVTLRRTQDGSGTMTIHFYSDEELDGILERLIGDEQL